MVKISLNSWLFLLPQTNKATVLSCRSLFGENKFSLKYFVLKSFVRYKYARTLRIFHKILNLSFETFFLMSQGTYSDAEVYDTIVNMTDEVSSNLVYVHERSKTATIPPGMRSSLLKGILGLSKVLVRHQQRSPSIQCLSISLFSTCQSKRQLMLYILV